MMSRPGIVSAALGPVARSAESLWQWLKSQSGTVAMVLLAAGILYSVQTVIPRLNREAEGLAKSWLAELHPTPVRMDPLAMRRDLAINNPEARRLSHQLDEIRRRRKVHGDIAMYFYARYYMAIMIASATGLLAASMLLHITRSGWAQAHRFAKVTFVVAAATAAYFGAFPTMFRQSQNISDNVALYLGYANLENEVLSYFATGENVAGQKQKPGEFVHVLDRRMAELNQIPIGFDATKLPNASAAFQGLP
jgi:hypothetical protein